MPDKSSMSSDPTPQRRDRPPVPAMVDYAVSLGEQQGTPHLRSPLSRLFPILRRRRPSPRDFAGFDPVEYLRLNPDVAEVGIAPLSHYAISGWIEGRRVSDRYNTRQYLAAHPRARQALLEIHAARLAAGSPVPFAMRPRRSRRKPGVLVVGYVEANLGLGESSRGLVRALAECDVPFGVYPYNVAVEDRYVGAFMPERYDKTGHYDVTLFEANGDQLPEFLDQFAHKLAGSHAIFRTYWELAEAPRAWRSQLSRFDEIWAPTEFVARAFRHVFEGPITVVPPCVSVAAGESYPRAHFGLDADRFLFVFTFDYSSIVGRKNPLGLVAAFRAAFLDPRDQVGLVLKSTGAPHLAPTTRAALALAAEHDPRIVLMDETLSRDEILSLVRVCDCYVSLHRSEGFGFGMAEALALGIPVLATDYSGSADFLNESTGYPVPYRLRPLREGDYPHGDGQSWAEPDLAAASALLREVRRDGAGREARAEAGRRLIEDRFGAAEVGRIAAERLRAILGTRPR
jgi:glycosyltransferase involved in cell wall biosynthesis